MSVLESMRSGSDSTFMQVVMALVVVSFIGWYAVPQGDKTSVIATVNGVKIMDTSYTREYRYRLRAAEARYGRTLNNAEQEAIGEQVRQGLIESEVVLQEAHALGLEVSDIEIARYIKDQPFSKNREGKYDELEYSNHLKRLSMTRAGFEEDIRRSMMREKLRLLVWTGSSLSEAELKQAWIEANTRVELEYVKVNARQFSEEVEVTDEGIDSYLVENETEVQERYDRDLKRLYDKPERVSLRMILLQMTDEAGIDVVLPKINTLREQIDKGADFAELAREHSQDPSAEAGGDLGERAVSQLSAEEARAIEGVEAGSLSRAVPTDRDVRLYEVTSRMDPETIALETVQREIAEAMLREEGGPTLAARFAEEDLLAKWTEAGTPPTDLLEARGMTAIKTGEIPVRSQANNLYAPPPDLLDQARSAEVGSVIPEVYEHLGSLWVAQLVSRVDPDEASYEAEKDTLREPVLAMKREAFYTAWVADAKARARIE